MSYNILISTIFPTKLSMADISFDFHDYIILYYMHYISIITIQTNKRTQYYYCEHYVGLNCNN